VVKIITCLYCLG